MTVQHARIPVFPDPRRLLLRLVLAFLGGIFISALLALLRDYLWGEDDGTPEAPVVEEFKAAVRETVNDVKHPLRAIRRGVSKEGRV